MNIMLIEKSLRSGVSVSDGDEKFSKPGRVHIVSVVCVPALNEKVRTWTVDDTPEGSKRQRAFFRLCSSPTHIDQARTTPEEAAAEQGAVAIAHVYRIIE